ncbi:MAG: DUF202 domain-containing protein [Mycobacteriaceae bacterium]|nr:DUF202 domain-containing protein [Mycobacteriaceae bacterium]
MSFAVLANGVLLMLRHFHGPPGPFRLIAVGLTVALTLFTYMIGIQRQRALGSRPLPQRISPRVEVRLVAFSVVVLVLVSTLALAV